MSERTRKRIVYATLPLAIIWAVFNVGKNKTAPPVASSPQAAIRTTQPPAPSTALAVSSKAIENLRNVDWGEDPFRTTPAPATRAPRANGSLTLTLGGIVYSNHAPVAFINKQMVKVGDRIGEATVVGINKKSVILNLNGRQITLKLSKG